METTYRLSEHELDERFLDAVKSLYKGKTISITIEEEDETNYLFSSATNKEKLLQSIGEAEGYELSLKEFNELSDKLLNGGKVDPAKLKKVKIA